MWKRKRHWWLYWGAWAIVAGYYASWDMLAYGTPVGYALRLNSMQVAVWAVLGLAVLWLADRQPIESFSLKDWKPWLLNILASVFLAILGLAIAYLISMFTSESGWRPHSSSEWLKGLRHFYSMYFHTLLLILLGVLAGYHGFRLYQRYQQRVLEAAYLQNSLAQARHQALRTQLQPHFLFNTLNSISALIHVDQEAADKMVARLADLLRLSLDTPVNQLIPLKREIETIQVYLAIEQVRFQERLQIEINVPPETQEIPVPSFILQPLVENALKHGISGRAKGGKITLRARREEEWLVIEVQDDGTGFEGGREGIGLSNTRSRLALIYADRQRLEIFSVRDKGTLVVLHIPA